LLMKFTHLNITLHRSSHATAFRIAADTSFGRNNPNTRAIGPAPRHHEHFSPSTRLPTDASG
jgi:hypothetical protein